MLNRSARDEALFWLCWLTGLAAFVGLAAWVRGEYYLPGDRAITFGVQDLYTRSWADDVFTAVNHLGDAWAFGLAIGVLAIVLWLRGFVVEAVLVIAAGLSTFAAIGIGSFAQRPDEVYNDLRAGFEGLLHPRIYPNPDGFPSTHVYAICIAYGLIIYMAPRLIPWQFATTAVQTIAAGVIIIGFTAPMYLGTHWFSDCVGAAILALLVLALVWRIDAYAHRNRVLVRVEDLIGRRANTANPTVAEARRPLSR
jgi:undecaprenyl-diphosphatase